MYMYIYLYISAYMYIILCILDNLFSNEDLINKKEENKKENATHTHPRTGVAPHPRGLAPWVWHSAGTAR
jgi:hypothetical protein